MSEMDEAREVLAAPGPDTPETTAFQLQLGPDGLCRLVLGEAGAPIAVLTLGAADADRLAGELAQRRETYDDRRKGQGGTAH